MVRQWGLSQAKFYHMQPGASPAGFVTLVKGQERQLKIMTAEKNHAGSSKSMERDVACELSRSTPIAGVKFSTYVRDDDSTTLADIHAKVPYDVQKWSDTVHTKTEISNKSLIQSQRTHPSIKTLFKLFCIKSKGDQLFCEMFQLCYNSKCRKFRCFKSKS